VPTSQIVNASASKTIASAKRRTTTPLITSPNRW
jgi:hypothetical protein